MAFIRVQRDDGCQENRAQGGNSENAEDIWSFSPTVEAAIGRGVVNTARTYLRLTRTDGTFVYIYVDTGTTVVCSTTQP